MRTPDRLFNSDQQEAAPWTYLNHLVGIRRATDLEALDFLLKGTGDEAREVLGKFRDNHAFDPEKILATELHIALDDNFVPIENSGDDAQIAEYEGMLYPVMLDSLTDAAAWARVRTA